MGDTTAAAVTPTDETPKQSAFEWWMVSNFAVGAGFAAFVALLIPPYVTEVTGSAADANGWKQRRRTRTVDPTPDSLESSTAAVINERYEADS